MNDVKMNDVKWDDVKWEALPAVTRRERSIPDSAMQALKENPNVWANMRECDRPNQASSAARYLRKLYGEGGTLESGFEIVARKGAVYARFVG